MFFYIYIGVRFRFCPWWFQSLCSLVCPARLFPLPIHPARPFPLPNICCVSSMRTGSKHLHSLVTLLPVATERRRNAPKRGGAVGPKVDSRKAGVCRVIRGGICHGWGAWRGIGNCDHGTSMKESIHLSDYYMCRASRLVAQSRTSIDFRSMFYPWQKKRRPPSYHACRALQLTCLGQTGS